MVLGSTGPLGKHDLIAIRITSANPEYERLTFNHRGTECRQCVGSFLIESDGSKLLSRIIDAAAVYPFNGCRQVGHDVKFAF